MKKLYSLLWGKHARPWLVTLVIILMGYNESYAQNQIFRETIFDVLAGDNVADAQVNGYFSERTLDYSGTAIGGSFSIGNIPQNNLPNASYVQGATDGYFIFGNTNGVGNDGTAALSTNDERTFVISNILGPINNPVLSFSLYIPTGRSAEPLTTTRNSVVVEVSTDGGATYSGATYSRSDGATSSVRNAWSSFKITSLPPASSLSIRFRKLQNINFIYAIDDVQLTGVRNNISVSETTLNFGNTNVNTRSAAKQLRIAGASLQNDIVVTAPDGFLVRKGTEAYSISTTLPRNGSGVVENTIVDVIFAPTVAKTYSATLSVTSAGSAAMSVTVNGTGVTPPPATLVAPPSIAFSGSTVVGQFSASENFTVSGNNLISNVTVTPPAANFQIRVGTTGTFTSNSITLTPTNGTLAETTLQVRFVPTTSGTSASSIRVNSTNAGEQAIALSATATPAPTGPTVNATPTDLVFGTASGSGSSSTLTFTVSGTNLMESLVLTPSNSNIVIREANNGDFKSSPLVFAPVDGTVMSRTIEVRLTGPVAAGAFSGTISVGSGNALPKTVNITATPVLEGNSTINTRGSLIEFSAVPGQPTAAQSYTITGTNLLQDVQVEAPNFFQVSLTNDFSGLASTGNKISIPRNSGNNLTETLIYVRYYPTGAQTNSSSILHNSDPAVQVSLSVTGSSEPSLVLEQAYTSSERVVLNTNGTAQGITLTGRRVNQPVTLSFNQSPSSANPSNTQQFQLSLDNVNFSNTLVITPDQQTRSISRTIYIRYSPTYLGGENGSSARLQFQSNDFVDSKSQLFATNALVGWSIDTRPSREAAVRVTRNGSTATVNFELPVNYADQGYGEGRLVIASEKAALVQLPINGTSYTTGNQVYGAQEFTGSPGYFVVYSGANSQALIESLDPTKTYYFYTFEYNNITTINGRLTSVQTAENYMTPTTPDAVPAYAAPGTPLPVELKSFAAALSNGRVKLDWVTASEKNNKGFEVQRSQDGKQFTTLQFVKGQGSKLSATSYAATDAQPLSGTSYYRLKQVDHDDTFAYSPVAAVTNTENAREISFYPNPAHDRLTIITGEPITGARVTVADLTGRIVLTSTLDASNGLSLNTLQAGTYLVTVEANSQKITRRVVKL